MRIAREAEAPPNKVILCINKCHIMAYLKINQKRIAKLSADLDLVYYLLVSNFHSTCC